ncbi:MAG: vWA domain-containing protein [Myxococcota bacterium]
MKTQPHFFTFGIMSCLTACAHMKTEAPSAVVVEEPEEITNSEEIVSAGEDALPTEIEFSEYADLESVSQRSVQGEEQVLVTESEGEIILSDEPLPEVSSEAFQILSKESHNGLTAEVHAATGLGGLGNTGVVNRAGTVQFDSGSRESTLAGSKGSVRGTYIGKKKSASPQLMAPMYDEGQAYFQHRNTEAYKDHGVNPFVDTADDALSTFSIDVDTASYTIARRKINSGVLPPMASVRAEEFINYFDYNYPCTDAQPFDVHIDGMSDPFRPDHHIVRVGVQGKELTAETRPPLHLTFLVDVSGSMSSRDKLPLARQAMHLLIDTLQEGDTVALATYAGRVARILEPTSGTNKRAIHAAIDSLKSGGSTAMSSGIDIAYDMAWHSYEVGAENRVVVLSDGDANVGKTGWNAMLSQIKGYADRGITLSTIGLGMGNYKDTTMEQLANNGDGNNYYIDSMKEARKIFVEGFNSTMISIARDVKIQVELNPDRVKAYRLIGYENRNIADQDFRNDRVDAGEVGAGHSVTALYELELTDNSFSAFESSDLMNVRLRYESPGADGSATERAWTYSNQALQYGQSDPSLRLAYTAGTFAEILRRSPYTTGISLRDLATYAESAIRPAHKEDVELLSLINKSVLLSDAESVVLR